jgi:hypothetical protein
MSCKMPCQKEEVGHEDCGDVGCSGVDANCGGPGDVFMHAVAYGFPRTPLLGNKVNRGNAPLGYKPYNLQQTDTRLEARVSNSGCGYCSPYGAAGTE